jgi:predicted transcriptional regulator
MEETTIIQKMADLGLVLGKYGSKRSEYQLGKPVTIFFEILKKGLENNHPIKEILYNAKYQVVKAWKRDYDNISEKTDKKLDKFMDLFYELLQKRYNGSIVRLYRDENFVRNTYIAFLRADRNQQKGGNQDDN